MTKINHTKPHATIKPPASPSPTQITVAVASYTNGDRLYEQIVTPRPFFAARDATGSHSSVPEFTDSTGRRIVPLSGRQLDPLRYGWGPQSVTLLPATRMPYGTVEDLDRRLRAHIHSYVRVPERFESVLPIFIRSTWLADRSPTAPYLRFTGSSSSGKSRASRVTGHVCRLPYRTTGSASEAAIFRNIASLGVCTTMIDENEYDERSDGQRALTGILKVGFEEDGFVERCAKVRTVDREVQEVERHPVFGPKIVAAINHVPDAALASRFISVPMRTTRDELPVELPPEYKVQVQELQNQLLQYRLDHYFAPLRQPARLSGVEGRLLQLYWPLAKVATAENLPHLDALIYDMQAERDEANPKGPDDRIAAALRHLAGVPGEDPIGFDKIAEWATNALPSDPVTAQQVGYFVRQIGLRPERKGNRGPRLLTGSREAILEVLARSGFEAEAPDSDG